MDKYYRFVCLFLTLLCTVGAKAQCDNNAAMCQVQFRMHDDYGDGWNGCKVNVYQGEILRGVVELPTGYNGETTINVCEGDFSLVWVSGSYASEVSFDVYSSDEELMFSMSDLDYYGTGDVLALLSAECGSCGRVRGLQLVASTINSLQLSWEAGDAAAWLLEYGPRGFVPGSGTSMVLTTPAVTISGLATTQYYDVYLRTVCSEGDTSSAKKVTYRTACATSCPINIVMRNLDNYSRGWWGAKLIITSSMDSVVVALDDSRSYDSIFVPLCQDEVTLQWQGGYSDYECAFRVYNYEGELLCDYDDLGGLDIPLSFTFDHECSSCARPGVPQLVGGSTTSIAVRWQGTAADSYSVGIAPIWSDSYTSYIVNDTTFTFTGLNAEETYRVVLRSICGSDTSRASYAEMRPAPAWIPTIHVSSTGTSSGTGASWNDAVESLRSALELAQEYLLFYNQVPEIWIARGRYSDTEDADSNNAIFTLLPGLHIYGGLEGNEPAGYDMTGRSLDLNRTEISTWQDGTLFYQPEPFTSATAAVIDGLVLSANTRFAELKDYATLRNCELTNAWGYDPVLVVEAYNSDPATQVALDKCRIQNSSCGQNAVIQLAHARMENCLVVECRSSQNVLRLVDGAIVSHSDFIDNVARMDNTIGGISNNDYAANQLQNSVVWSSLDFGPQSFSAIGTGVEVSHSAVVGGADGVGNINLEASNSGAVAGRNYPNFVYPPFDIRVNSGSALIDAASSTVASDLYGNPRPYGAAPDMGCYEYQGADQCPNTNGLYVSYSYSYAAVVSFEAFVDHSYTLRYRPQIGGEWTTLDFTVDSSMIPYLYGETGTVSRRLDNLAGATPYFVQLIHHCPFGDSDILQTEFTTDCPSNIGQGECDTEVCPLPGVLAYPVITDTVMTFSVDVAHRPVLKYQYAGGPVAYVSDCSHIDRDYAPWEITAPAYANSTCNVWLADVCPNGDTSEWLFLSVYIPPVQLSRIYVREGAQGAGNGSSWYHACTDIHQAIAHAQTIWNYFHTLCDIWVAEGTYYGDTLSNAMLDLSHGWNIYGGFAGNEPDDFDLDQRRIADHPTILDGRHQRTVINRSYTNSGEYATYSGLIIQNGYHDYDASGVHANSPITLSHCIVRNNQSNSNSGGGVYMSEGRMYNCLIADNTSNFYGGAYLVSTSVDHCTFAGNRASNYSALRYIGSNSDTITNSIIWGNVNTAGSGAQVYITGGILQHNASKDFLGGSDNILLEDINAGTTEGNFVAFADPQNGDYRLTSSSVCINKAATYRTYPYDLAGNVRVFANVADLGCYEYSGQTYCVPPYHVWVEEVSATSALLRWSGYTDDVVIEISPADENAWTAYTAHGSQYALLGLESEHEYQVRIKSVCGGSHSLYSQPMIFSTVCPSSNQFVFGNPSNYQTTYSSELPLHPYYRYSHTQTIITADELSGLAMTIPSISYQYIHNSTITRNINIYMAHTTAESFSSSFMRVPAADYTLVYSGNVTFSRENLWTDIPLDSPFDYNGVDNLAIAVIDNTGSYFSSGNYFATHYTTTNKSVSQYSDNYAYSLSDVTSTNLRNYRSNMQITLPCDTSACVQPNILPVEVTDQLIKLICVSTSDYEIQYRQSGSEDYIALVPSDTITLTGLLQNTTYVFRARTICSNADTSVWTTLTVATQLRRANHFYVKPVSCGSGDGTSWDNAMSDINLAIVNAEAVWNTYHTRAQIWVAEGTYYGNTAAESAFTVRKGVDVYGGFVGNEPEDYDLSLRDWTTHRTILDGQHQHRVLGQDDYYYFDTIRWDGFVIQHGSSTFGGGVYLLNGTTLSNSIITDCEASSAGGAYVYGGRLENCRIENNLAHVSSGGAQINNATVVNCTFVNDTASDYSAMTLYGSTAVNTLIANNSSYNSTIGLSSGDTLINCVIVANHSVIATPQNNPFSSYSNVPVINSIVWGNQSDAISMATEPRYNVAFDHCAIQGPTPTDAMNNTVILSASNDDGLFSPRFVRPSSAAGMGHADGDWTLQPNSVLIDRGTRAVDATRFSATDLAGNARLQGEKVDIGCYETTASGTTAPTFADHIIYVTPTGAGLRDGTSWTNAMSDIQEASRMANLYDSMAVWVAAGTYYGDTASDRAFNIASGVQLYGGFVGSEPANYDITLRNCDTHPTILDGAGQRAVLNIYSSTSSANRTHVDGFVIQNGYSTHLSGVGVTMGCYSSISNCVIRNNVVNSALPYGITGVALALSEQSYYVDGNDIFMVDRCRIENNVGQSSVNSGLVQGMISFGYGIMSNTLVANNECQNYGVMKSFGSAQIQNCTFVANQTHSGNSFDCSYYGNTFRNCIVWNNLAPIVDEYTTISDQLFQHCAIDEVVPGVDNLVISSTNDEGDILAPGFVAPTAGIGSRYQSGDWHLRQGSICVGRGTDMLPVNQQDLDGNPRVQADGIDLGCYESVHQSRALPQVGEIIYVTQNGTGDGSSWNNALGSLTTALKLSSFSPARPSIWVAGGVYYGDTIRDQAFVMVDGVNVYGSMQGDEPPTFDPDSRYADGSAFVPTTILDGMHRHRVLSQPKPFRTPTRWDGFEIRNGKNIVPNNMYRTVEGVGVYLQNNGQLYNSVVHDNTVDSVYYANGIGVYATYGAKVEGCDIWGNGPQEGSSVTIAGGGLALINSSVHNSHVHHNHGTSGGGIHAQGGLIVNTVVDNNEAESGAGLYLERSEATNITASQNTASQNGGGVYVSYNNTLAGGLVANNRTHGIDGAGIYSLYDNDIYNYTIVDNFSEISSYYTSYPSVAIAGSASLYNSVLWGNRCDAQYIREQRLLTLNGFGSGITFDHCAIEGDSLVDGIMLLATDNFGSDTTLNYPQFVSAENADYRISSLSALYNRGGSVVPPTLTSDLAGQQRVFADTIDIGCYEYDGQEICYPMSRFGIVMRAGTDVLFGWSARNQAPDSLEFWYRAEGEIAWTIVPLVSGTTTHFLRQLAPQTTYEAKVRTLCGNEAGQIFTRTVTFHTDCSHGQDTVFDVLAGMETGISSFPFVSSYSGGDQLCYTQQIYPASVMQGFVGLVDSLYFRVTEDNTRSVSLQVYMGLTDKESFLHSGDYVDPLQLTLVYDGLLGRNEDGYRGVELSQPFIYDGSSNLVLAVKQNQTITREADFYNHSNLFDTVGHSITYYSSYEINLRRLTENSYLSNHLSEIRLVSHHCQEDSCAAPLLAISEITQNSVTFEWAADSSVTFQYRRFDEPTFTTVQPSRIDGTSLTNLIMGTNYVARLRRQCPYGSTDWYEIPFSTRAARFNRLYVTPQGAGLGDGSSWSNAVRGVRVAQRMADNIHQEFDIMPEIWVAQGTYYGDTNSVDAFELIEGMNLYGGFAGNEPADFDLSQRDIAAHPTILDANNINRVLVQKYDFNTLTVCDGFILQNGYGVDISGVGAVVRGNGALINCIVRNNTLIAHEFDPRAVGVLALSYGQPAQIINTSITNNYSSSTRYGRVVKGGGLYAREALVANCKIIDNSAYRAGGLYAESNVKIFNTVIAANHATEMGGAYLERNDTLANVTIALNTSDNFAGGVYSEWNSVIYNSIVWGNKMGYMVDNYSSGTEIYSSAVEGGMPNGSNIITLSSMNDGASSSEYYVRFVDPQRRNFALHSASNCVDAGDTTLAYWPTDILGGSRIQGATIDLGAYESETQFDCLSPINLRTTGVSGTSLSLAWSPRGTETQWVVVMANQNDETTITSYDTTLTVTGLTVGNEYTFYVKAFCGNTYSFNSPQLTVNTLCDTLSLQPLSPVTLVSPIDSSAVLGRTVDLEWVSVPEATSYDLYIWRTDMPEPSTPNMSGLQMNILGNVSLPQFEDGKYYNWKVVAWNECISRSSQVGTFLANPLADLHVSDLSFSSAMANQSITITYTVTNDGNGATPPGATWNDNFWIVVGIGIRMFDGSDSRGYLGEVPNLRGLGPGESYTNTVTFTIPPHLMGNYFLFALTDMPDAFEIYYAERDNDTLNLPVNYTPSVTGVPYNYLRGSSHGFDNGVREYVENDNFFYKQISILPPPSPDLQVTHVSHPTTTFSNQLVPFTWTVTNNGSAEASLGRWVDYLYLQAIEGPLDMLRAICIDSVRHFDRLPVGESYTVNTLTHIPIQMFGSYYVHVVTDKRNEAFEGIYETNNEASSGQVIDITMAPVADLVVSNIGFADTVSPLCRYPLSSTITNVGSGVTNEPQWLDDAYLSPTPYLDPSTAVLLGSHAYSHRTRYLCYEHNGSETYCLGNYDKGVLSPDSSYEQFDYGDRYSDRVYKFYYAGRHYDKDERYENLYATIPRYVGGDYYIIVRADSQDDVFEYDAEDNNDLAKPIFIANPDLVVTGVVYDSVVEVNRRSQVSAFVKNIGQGRSYSFVYNRLMLDNDTVYAGIWLDLAPGDSQAISFTFTQQCALGNQGHFRIQTNVSYKNSDTIYEYRAPFNNLSDVYTYHVLQPDLLVGAINYPDTVWSGLTAMVDFQIQNNGELKVDSLGFPVAYNIYISNRPDQLIADDAHHVGSGSRRLNLMPGQSGTVSQQVSIPNGYNGVYYLHVVLDPDNWICENNETNNAGYGTLPMRVNLSPYPDLVVTQAIMPDTVSLGQNVSFSFSIANQGTAPIVGNLSTRVFMSQSAVFNQQEAKPVATLHRTVDMAVGDTISAVVAGLIPNNLMVGNYYFYVFVDYPDEHYEYTFENNNIYRSSRRFVKSYPLDLAVDSIVGPSVVEWGQVVHYTMYISNRSVVRSLNYFSNQLYTSVEGSIISQDTVGKAVSLIEYLDPGSSSSVTFTFKVPYGMPNQLFLIGVCDNSRSNPDIDYTNNQIAIPITINPVATVDYQASDFHVVDSAVAGQSVRVAYQVRNVSDAEVLPSSWYRFDHFFLSGDSSYSVGDVYIDMAIMGGLRPGEVEYDTVEVRLPLPYQGDMNLLVYVNGSRNHFETNLDNNITSTPIHITMPLPGDLMVSDVTVPDTVVSGFPAQFSWNVVNVGVNNISGRGLGSLAYISDDDQFDVTDKLIGSVITNNNINLAPGDTVTQQIQANINGMPEGDYYLFVKTDVRNMFNEDNEENNEAISASTFALRLRTLPFGVTIYDTLVNGQISDYKLPVDTVQLQTVRISVSSPDSLRGAVNNIYVANNTIANNLSYHLSTVAQNAGNPELYIPATKGDYYGVSIYGTTPVASQQIVGLRADILPFELHSVSPNFGGNDGDVTVKLTGSHFRPDMKVWIERNGDTLYADRFTFVNYYESFAHFNLLGADTGRYSVGVLNYCEGEGALSNAFTVVPPSPLSLGYTIVPPSAPRGNRIISLMLEFGNIGNTDIRDAVLELESVGGCPISLTPEGLRQGTTMLRLPLSIEGEPQGLLRPGSQGTITIYCQSSGNLVFSIKEVNGL